MYTLYTSATCPKGVVAQSWLAEKLLTPEVVDVDRLSPESFRAVQSLVEDFLGSTGAPLELPLLTKTEAQKQSVVAIGFSATQWGAVV